MAVKTALFMSVMKSVPYHLSLQSVSQALQESHAQIHSVSRDSCKFPGLNENYREN